MNKKTALQNLQIDNYQSQGDVILIFKGKFTSIFYVHNAGN